MKETKAIDQDQADHAAEVQELLAYHNNAQHLEEQARAAEARIAEERMVNLQLNVTTEALAAKQ